MIDIQVVNQGPLYERLMTRWRELDGRQGYISAHVLFLAAPTGDTWDGRTPVIRRGVWFLPIVTGPMVGPPEERLRTLAEHLLEATLRFTRLLDAGMPLFLEVPDLNGLWPPPKG